MKTNFTPSKLFSVALALILYFGSPDAGYGSAPAENCPSGLLVLLRLDEASGPNYADYYGVHNATSSYAPTAVTGKISGGQLFNADTKINIPDKGTEFDWSSEVSFSVECWMKTSVKQAQVAIGRFRTDTEIMPSWWLGTNPDGYATLEIKDNDGNNTVLSASTNLADNQWHHVVGVRNAATNHNKVYVDGVEVADGVWDLPAGVNFPLPTDITVGYLLRGNDYAPEYHFNGALDEIGIFTRALTADEVASFYNAGSPVSHCASVEPPVIDPPQNPGNCPSDLLFLLTLDETSGPNYADFNGVHNATASTSPTAVPGIVNGGQLFNDNTFVKIADNGNDFEWAAGCSFSLEFWIKTSTHTVPQVGISRQIAGSGITWWLGINEYGGAVMELKDSDGNNYAVYNKDFSVSYADNQWHHIVGVKNGATNYLALYVDGQLIEGKTAAFTGNFIAPSPTDVSIGYMLRADGSSFTYHVNGALDEAAVYTRALSADEIVSFYNNGAPVCHCSSNKAPLVTSTPVITATEDVIYSYTFTVDDENAGDVLTLSAVTKPSWLNFSWTPGQKSAVLSGTPGNANAGTFNVVLRVSDNHTEVDQSFSVNVAAVNDVPVITGQNVLYVDEDHVLALTKSDLLITDVDNPSTDLVLQVLAGSNYSFDGNTITPVANYYGQLSVNVVVKDLAGQSEVYPVMITVNPLNDAPVITSDPVLTAKANVAYIYAITVEDKDAGDVLTITAPTKPDWLTLTTSSNTAFLTGMPTNSNVGSCAIVIKVNDGHQDVMQGFAIQVSGTTGIDNIDNGIVSLVYPNPANDKVYFKLANTGSVKIQIFDITGNLKKEISGKNEAVFEINISDMLSGIYIYKAYQNGKVAMGKITRN